MENSSLEIGSRMMAYPSVYVTCRHNVLCNEEYEK